MNKNYEWTVVVTCQGNPRYHPQRNLLFGIVALVCYYYKYRKYGTMNFALKQKMRACHAVPKEDPAMKDPEYNDYF